MTVMDRKKCCICNKYLTSDNQYVNNKKWYICKKCANDYFRRRAAKSRVKLRDALKSLKVNGCAICGYNDCDEALDFHHVTPWNKKFQVCATNMCRKNEDIIEEVNKCILLCKNCHTKLHATTRKNPLERQGYIQGFGK